MPNAKAIFSSTRIARGFFSNRKKVSSKLVSKTLFYQYIKLLANLTNSFISETTIIYRILYYIFYVVCNVYATVRVLYDPEVHLRSFHKLL